MFCVYNLLKKKRENVELTLLPSVNIVMQFKMAARFRHLAIL